MAKKSKVSQASRVSQVAREEAGEKKAVVYVSLYKGESVNLLAEQIRKCLQVAAARQQSTIEILGDIEDPLVSIGDISLSYPPYKITIVDISLYNGRWSGFRLLATTQDEHTA